MKSRSRLTAPLALLPLLAPTALADEVQVDAEKDNTLYEDAQGALSNGAGSYFFAGRTGQPAGIDIRRGLIEFDVAAAVPAGAVITEVTLRLRLSNAATSTGTDVTLYTAQAEWGEAGSDAPAGEGSGAAAQPGDATWLHTFFPGSFWSSPGGDYAAAPSATTNVGGLGTYEWSSAQMVADAQAWLDDPSQNHGWVLVGNEISDTSAKRFDSRNNNSPGNRPVLIVRYDPPSITQYCFGTGCPCNNDDPTAGCGNGTFGEGSELNGAGTPSVGADTFVLQAVQSTPFQPGLFFQGNAALNNGNGIVFGDGLRCAGSNVIRLQTVSADPTGAASTSIGIAAQGAVSAGDIRRYQWWYRDPALSPCGNGFNLSNGLEVTWAP